MKKYLLCSIILFITTNSFAKTDKLLIKAFDSYRKSNYSKALNELARVQRDNLDRFRNDTDFRDSLNYWKAITLNRLQRYDLALKYFKSSKNYAKYEKDFYYEYGQCLFALQSYDLAIRQFQIALKNNYKETETLFYIGYIHRLNKKPLESKKAFHKLLRIVPSDDVSFIQSIRFELNNTELEIVKKPQLNNGQDTSDAVRFHIIPEYKRIIRLDNKSYLANVIREKIIQLTQLYDKSLADVLKVKIAGPIGFRFVESLYNDSNVILEASNFPNPTESPSSLINRSALAANTTYSPNQYVFLFTELEVNKTFHLNRDYGEVTQFDSTEVIPKFKTNINFSMFTNPVNIDALVYYKHHSSNYTQTGDLKYLYSSTVSQLKLSFSYFLDSPSFATITRNKTSSDFEALSYGETGFSVGQRYRFRWGHFLELEYYTSEYKAKREIDRYDLITKSLTYYMPGLLSGAVITLGLQKSEFTFSDSTQVLRRGEEDLEIIKLEYMKRLRSYLNIKAFFHKHNKRSLDSENYAYKKAKVGVEFQLEI